MQLNESGVVRAPNAIVAEFRQDVMAITAPARGINETAPVNARRTLRQNNGRKIMMHDTDLQQLTAEEIEHVAGGTLQEDVAHGAQEISAMRRPKSPRKSRAIRVDEATNIGAAVMAARRSSVGSANVATRRCETE